MRIFMLLLLVLVIGLGAWASIEIAHARNPRGIAVVVLTGTSVINFAFVPPTQNTDNSTLNPGEVTGYELGLRTSGSAGTYPTVVELEQSTNASMLSASIIPGLSTGTYFAAVHTTGATPSAWSTESSFTVN